ncbi:MAG TPA: hypothetical protein VFJ82_16080, partial [Longimicrobium sp.]|nr:hypothetical protein [Longimicrobium sp.]
IIDFDSGAVTDAPDESPTTFGKLTEGEWLAPEIMEQMLKNRTQRATVQVTQFTDNWAVAVGIHYLLFLCGPFFLLDRPSTRNIRDYAARHGWPRHDPVDPLFAPGMDDAYRVFTELVLEVPAEVIRQMRHAMTVGVDSPDRRPTYYQWTAALKTAQTPLGIPVFRVVPASTVAGRPVRLEWEVTGARRVSIDQGIGDVDEAGGVEVFPAQSQGWTLTAEGRGGAPVTATASVAVWPVPVVRSVFVPAPDLRHTVVLRNVGVSAPRLSIPAPRIELAAPTLRMPLKLDLSVRLGDDRPGAFPGNLLARALPPASALAWPRRDWVPRIGDTFERLAARVRHELTTRFGGGAP